MPPVTIIASRSAEILGDGGRDGVGVIAHDAVELDAMTRRLEHLFDELPALVVVGRAGIARGQHAHSEIGARMALMFLYTHPSNLYITEAFRKVAIASLGPR